MHLQAEKLTAKEKQTTIEQLLEASAPCLDFFLMLILSTICVALGLWQNNLVVIIGGMLIAPMLYPILSISMGIVVVYPQLIKRGLKVLLLSILYVLAISVMVSLFFTGQELSTEILLRTQADTTYFWIAIVSGVAMSYALARPNLSAVLPGVAINVALVPPLATIGVTLASFKWHYLGGAMQIFFLNLIGIIFASIVVFAMMDFYKAKKVIQDKLDEENKEIEKQKEKEQKQAIKEISKNMREATILLKRVKEEEESNHNKNS